MNDQNIKIDLGPVQETLMLPLWARARETEKDNPIVCDTYAKNIVERIDYDFSQIEEGPVADHQGVWAIRAYNFDNINELTMDLFYGSISTFRMSLLCGKS